jgi:hypothetical protein
VAEIGQSSLHPPPTKYRLGSPASARSLLQTKVVSELKEKLRTWCAQNQWEEWKDRVVGVAGSFAYGSSTVNVVGRAGKTYHLSSGGDGNGLTIIGCLLDEEHWRALGEVVTWCEGKIKPAKKMAAPVNRETIAIDWTDVPLPDGWQYDGRNYVDFYGMKSRLRPDIEDVVKLEEKKRGGAVEEFNRSVDALDEDGVGLMQSYRYIKG